MKKSISAAIAGLIILVLTGCATVKFYSNPVSAKNAGLKYYTVKPYLQLEKDAVNSNVIKATVIYLPDLANPQYMLIRDGLWNRKVDLKLTEGSLSTLGVSSDPKIAETVNALSGLISKGASAIIDLAALKSIPPTAAAATITELYEVFMGPDGTSLKKVEFK